MNKGKRLNDIKILQTDPTLASQNNILTYCAQAISKRGIISENESKNKQASDIKIQGNH